MALLTNGAAAFGSTMTLVGQASYRCIGRRNFNGIGSEMGRFYSEAAVPEVTEKSAIPSGYLHPGAWVLPMKAGAVASRFEIVGAGDISQAAAESGYPTSATIDGSGDIVAAAGSLIASAVATLSGSGDLTASSSGILNASAALAGSGDLVASLTALASVVATLTGTSSVSASSSAIANVSAEMTTLTELSPENLAASVWNSVAANFNASGTMGEVLNSAGGGSSPSQVAAAVWDALRATNQDAGSMGEALVELFDLMGLDPTKPLVVTPTSREAGDIEQTIATVGTTTTVTRDP